MTSRETYCSIAFFFQNRKFLAKGRLDQCMFLVGKLVCLCSDCPSLAAVSGLGAVSLTVMKFRYMCVYYQLVFISLSCSFNPSLAGKNQQS